MVPKWVFWAPKWHCADFYDKIYHVPLYFFLHFMFWERIWGQKLVFATIAQKGTKMGPLGYQNINVHTFLITHIIWPLMFLHFIFKRRISGQKYCQISFKNLTNYCNACEFFNCLNNYDFFPSNALNNMHFFSFFFS